MEKETVNPLLQIEPANVLHSYPILKILDNISFFKNQGGSNSLRVGDEDCCCLLTDDGRIVADTDIYSYGYVSGIAFLNSSREETKKNIKKFNKRAIDIIKQSDIYEFNYKVEKDGSKKHLGCVIGENYNYSNEITVEKDNKEVGVDTYSMISVAYKAIQEQQEEIEELKEKNRLKDLIIENLTTRIENLEKRGSNEGNNEFKTI